MKKNLLSLAIISTAFIISQAYASMPTNMTTDMHKAVKPLNTRKITDMETIPTAKGAFKSTLNQTRIPEFYPTHKLAHEVYTLINSSQSSMFFEIFQKVDALFNKLLSNMDNLNTRLNHLEVHRKDAAEFAAKEAAEHAANASHAAASAHDAAKEAAQKAQEIKNTTQTGVADPIST